MAGLGRYLLSVPLGLGFGAVGFYVLQQIGESINTDAVPMWDVIQLSVSVVLVAAGMGAAISFL